MPAEPINPSKILYGKINRKCVLKGRYEYCMVLSQDTFLLPFLGYGPTGPSRKQECNKKVDEQNQNNMSKSESSEVRLSFSFCRERMTRRLRKLHIRFVVAEPEVEEYGM